MPSYFPPIQALASVAHKWVNAISGAGVASASQPAAADVSGLAASATNDTTNASNITSGTLAATRGGAGSVSGILKANGSGTISAATANTDYTKPGGMNFFATGSTLSITSTSEVMVGFGCTFTPSSSGRLFVMFTGGAYNGSANCGSEFHIRYGTGTAPSNGAAATGTALGGAMPAYMGSTANQVLPYCCTAIVGLSAGTTYWFDLGAIVVTGGTALWVNNSFGILEF